MVKERTNPMNITRRDALKTIAAAILLENCVPQTKSKGNQLTKLDNTHWIATALICDSPNKNNRIYPKEIVQKAIEKYNQNPTNLGTLGNSNDAIIHFQDVSHTITKTYLENNELKVEIEILNTPPGKILQNLLKNPEIIAFRTQGVGNQEVNENGELIINNYSLISINALPANEAS
jgi:hypothetical protein